MTHFPHKAQKAASTHKISEVDPRILRASMVRSLHSKTGIKDKRVLKVMNDLQRHLFVQDVFRMQAYEDRPLPIGHGQTISQPSTVAFMTESLELEPGMRVLEIGTGSGYQAAVLALMGCRVYTVERIPELFKATRTLLTKTLQLNNIYMKLDDGTLGMEEAAPFDRILVTAGGPEVPKPLIKQLDEGGIMLIPVGDQKREQHLVRIRREKGQVIVKNLGPAAFVDLVGNHGW